MSRRKVNVNDLRWAQYTSVSIVSVRSIRANRSVRRMSASTHSADARNRSGRHRSAVCLLSSHRFDSGFVSSPFSDSFRHSQTKSYAFVAIISLHFRFTPTANGKCEILADICAFHNRPHRLLQSKYCRGAEKNETEEEEKSEI